MWITEGLFLRRGHRNYADVWLLEHSGRQSCMEITFHTKVLLTREISVQLRIAIIILHATWNHDYYFPHNMITTFSMQDCTPRKFEILTGNTKISLSWLEIMRLELIEKIFIQKNFIVLYFDWFHSEDSSADQHLNFNLNNSPISNR